MQIRYVFLYAHSGLICIFPYHGWSLGLFDFCLRLQIYKPWERDQKKSNDSRDKCSKSCRFFHMLHVKRDQVSIPQSQLHPIFFKLFSAASVIKHNDRFYAPIKPKPTTIWFGTIFGTPNTTLSSCVLEH